VLGVFGLTLAPHGLHARPVRGFLLRGQPAANVRPPRLGKSAAPVAESSGGNAVIMENIPARIIAELPVAREAMQLAVWLDDFRRVQPSAVDRRAELLDGFTHGDPSGRGLAARLNLPL
jgi:hypothetical protein